MKRMIRNFIVFTKDVWNVEKRYFLYVLCYMVGVGIFSYTLIRLPTIVLTMVEEQVIDYQILLITFGTLLASALVSAYCRVLYVPVGSKIRYYYLLRISEQNITIPYEEYDKPEIQTNIWNVSRPVTSIDKLQAIYTNFAQLSGNVVILVLSANILFRLSIWISSMIILWFLFYTSLSVRKANKIDQSFQKAIHLYREEWYLNDIGVDVAYGKEIRVFQLQNWLQAKMEILYQRLNHVFKQNETDRMIPNILDDSYQWIRDSIIYSLLVLLFFQKRLTVAEFTSYSVLIAQLNRALSASAVNLMQLLSSHENYEKMIAYVSLPKQSDEGVAIDPHVPWTIAFEQVSFQYPGTDHYIYRDLNFTIHQGHKLAIVGLNGVGKTTLLKLLLRLYRPTSGRITLNGVAIQDYSLNAYFQLFAPVFQEINIFPFTIKENLTFGKEIENAALMQALAQAGLDETVIEEAQLEQEYMTRYLHSHGRVLSGGQAQKFVTARAIASARPIYIFDEPTSALDAIAESAFYHQIETTMKDHTILFVSHRLASTQFCDEIILIEQERILEKGSHLDLLQKQGRYAELFQMQAKYYQTGEAYEKQMADL